LGCSSRVVLKSLLFIVVTNILNSTPIIISY